MKIVRLTAENIKRLTAVEIEPDGNVVVISGRNGAGKTSVLDAIWFALAGGQAQKETTRPVRDGEDHAAVSLDLGDLIVTRTWNVDGKSTLRVENHDGARYTSPQQMLDALVGRLSFDPLSFAGAAPKEQLATLLSLVELPFEPDELDAKRRGLFERRTDVNRDVKALQARLDAMSVPAEDVPAEEVSAATLLAEHRQAVDQIRATDEAEERLENARRDVDRAKEQLVEAQRWLETTEATLRRVAAEDIPERPDVAAIEERLATVEVTNEAVRAAKARAAVADELEGLRAQSEELTAAINGLDLSKQHAIRNAAMPIEGLGFDDEGVTYGGVPFKQASAAEQLRVSLAMAMALNPTLRVVRITDGSLLDADGLRLVAEMADEHDFQIWLERVAGDEPVGVVIEAGEVESTPETRAETATR